jgi:hypothetical protein
MVFVRKKNKDLSNLKYIDFWEGKGGVLRDD